MATNDNEEEGNAIKEKIILAPGAGGSELLRMLAKSGTGTIGMRVMSSVELSKYALMKSGIAITEELLTRKEEPSVIFLFLKIYRISAMRPMQMQKIWPQHYSCAKSRRGQ